MRLALDISTSCTGWCVFDDNKNFVKMGFIDLSKIKGFFNKCEEIKNNLDVIFNSYKINIVYVEQNLQSFRPGLSSAQTLMTLAQFNGTVQWICHSNWNVNVISINVNSARKAVGIKVPRGSNTKEFVLNWVTENLNSYEWPTKILKSGPNKGQERLLSGCYDMADAYVIGKASFSV